MIKRLLVLLLMMCASTMFAQSNYINAVSITPDGAIAYTFNPDKSLIVKWNTKYGWPLDTVHMNYKYLTILSTSADHQFSAYNGNATLLYDENGTRKGSFAGKGFIERTGKYVITYQQDALKIYEASTGTEAGTLTLPGVNTSQEFFGHKVISAAANRIALTKDQKEVFIYDLSSGQSIFSVPKLKGLKAIALHHEGNLLALGFEDGKVMVYDVDANKKLRQFTIFKNMAVKDVRFGKDQRYVSTLCMDGADDWDLQEEQVKQKHGVRVGTTTRYVDKVTGMPMSSSFTSTYYFTYYDHADDFNYVCAVGNDVPYFKVIKGEYQAYNKYLEIIGSPLPQRVPNTDLMLVHKLGSRGEIASSTLADTQGNILIPESGAISFYTVDYDAEDGKKNTFLKVKTAGSIKLLDKQGKEIGDLAYDDVHYASKNKFNAVTCGSRKGLVDAELKPIGSCEYDDTISSRYDLAAVKMKGLWGYVDVSGKLVIAPQYDQVSSTAAKGEPIAVSKGGKWGYVDHQGNVVVPLIFDEAGSFRTDSKGKLYAIVKQKGKRKVVDEKGNITEE